MSILVPREEIAKLKSLILETFNNQQGTKIANSNIYFEFIEPRLGAFCGAEIRTLLPDKFLKIRVYVTGYGVYGKFGEYKIEMIINTDQGLDDYTYVNLAELPQAFFPVLYALTHPPSVPDYERDSVENPVASGKINSEPQSDRGGTINILTSEVYPEYQSDQILNELEVKRGGTLDFLTSNLYPEYKSDRIASSQEAIRGGELNLLTSNLYPVFGNELFQSIPVAANGRKILAPIVTDKFGVLSALDLFIINISPYVAGKYYYTPSNGLQYESIGVLASMDLFTLLQTYFPFYYSMYFPSGLSYESFDINPATIDTFSLVQTYFPYYYTFTVSGGTTFESFGVAASLDSFTIA